MVKLGFIPPKGWGAKKPAVKVPAKKAIAVKKGVAVKKGTSAKKIAKATLVAGTSHTGIKAAQHGNTGRYYDYAKKATRQTNDVDESGPLAAAHELAQQLFDVGAIDKMTMREFDDLCLPKVPEFSAAMIAKIRREANVSQNLFAKYLNTSASTVQQWETGAKKPSGAAAKLLQIVKKRGIDVLG